MDRRIDNFKQAYQNIEIPEELDLVVEKAIKRGQRTKRVSILRKTATAAALFVLFSFTAAINFSPAFADALSTIPGTSGLVKVLQFTKGTAIGGQVTDGKQVGPVDREITVDKEIITIPIISDGIPADTANFFVIKESAYPYSLIIELFGLRYSNATLPDFKDSKLVAGMQKLVTLDDSAERYLITFTGPVTIQASEESLPAGIVINLAEASPETLSAVYSVRSASLPLGEQIGAMEEGIHAALNWQADTVRMLVDEAGKLTVEAAYFATEAEAEAFRSHILASAEVNFSLFIEKRGPSDLPASITE